MKKFYKVRFTDAEVDAMHSAVFKNYGCAKHYLESVGEEGYIE